MKVKSLLSILESLEKKKKHSSKEITAFKKAIQYNRRGWED